MSLMYYTQRQIFCPNGRIWLYNHLGVQQDNRIQQ